VTGGARGGVVVAIGNRLHGCYADTGKKICLAGDDYGTIIDSPVFPEN
jgi:hypothetical protein